MVIGTRTDLFGSKAAAIEKKLILSFDTNAYLAGETIQPAFFHPILFHPDLISEQAYEQAAALADGKDRRIGILFAGNCDPRVYDTPGIGEQYGVMNRIEIEGMVNRLPPETVFKPRSEAELIEQLETGGLTDRLVWIDTKHLRIPQDQWLAFIAQARFFLATPGVEYPYCQNLNEAAACGAVPLLEFPNAYQPALRDGTNCLTFDDFESFAATVKNAVETRKTDWLAMSNAAIGYHQTHLSLAALQKRLRLFLEDPEQTSQTWVMAGKERQ